jgi:hemoglobin-like flavoprotein
VRAAVVESLDLLAQRGIDPTAEVYTRVFARWPETEALFVRDTTGAVRSHMLFEVIEAVLDHGGPSRYARGYVASERVHHVDDLGVSDEAYVGLFDILRDVVRDALGRDWTDDMATGWSDLIATLRA